MHIDSKLWGDHAIVQIIVRTNGISRTNDENQASVVMDGAYILSRSSLVWLSVVAFAERGSVIMNYFILDEATIVSSALLWVIEAGEPLSVKQTELKMLQKTSFWLLVKWQMLL